MLWNGAEAAWKGNKPEWDARAAAIDVMADDWQPGDAVVVRGIHDVNVFYYYATKAGLVDFDVRCLVGHIGESDTHLPHFASLDKDHDLITSLSALEPRQFNRIWVQTRDALPREEDLLRWHRQRTWGFPDGSQLALYSAAEGETK
jgi:hypothetical protein